MVVVPPFLFALMVTLLTETFIYRLLKPHSMYFLLFILLMNSFLNPLMNELLFIIPNASYIIALIILESVIVLVETALISKVWNIAIRKTLIFSLLANGCSLTVGILLQFLRWTNRSLWISSMIMMIPIVILLVWSFFNHQFQKRNKKYDQSTD
jgi:hypothetical protein